MKNNSTKPRTDKLRPGRNWGGNVPGRAQRAPIDDNQDVDLIVIFVVDDVSGEPMAVRCPDGYRP